MTKETKPPSCHMRVGKKIGKVANPLNFPEGSTFLNSRHPSLGGRLLSADSFLPLLPLFSVSPLRDASARCDKADKRYLDGAIKPISPRSFEMIITSGPWLQVS